MFRKRYPRREEHIGYELDEPREPLTGLVTP